MRPSSTHGASAPSATRPSNLHLLLFAGLAAVLLRLTHLGSWHGWWLEDLPVYEHALGEWLAGQTPYNASLSPLYFLYPPFFLFVGGLFAHLLPGRSGEFIYIGVHIVATCALPLVLARYFFRQSWLEPVFALLLFFASPRFAGVDALFMANIASLLYCLAFLGAVPGLKRNRWEWFYLAVMLAAMIKITFLALLLLPLLAGRRQWLRSVACGAVVVAGNVGERLLWPQLYEGYQWSLRQGILAGGSYGFGVFGILARFQHKKAGGVGLAPYAVSLLLAVAIVALLFLLRRRLELWGNPELWGNHERWGDLAANGHWLALLVIAVILVNPRELQYDMDVALFAAYMLWVYVLRTRRLLLLMAASFLPGLAVPLVVPNPHLWGMYATLLVLAAFAAGYWRLWREAGDRATLTASAGAATGA